MSFLSNKFTFALILNFVGQCKVKLTFTKARFDFMLILKVLLLLSYQFSKLSGIFTPNCIVLYLNLVGFFSFCQIFSFTHSFPFIEYVSLVWLLVRVFHQEQFLCPLFWHLTKVSVARYFLANFSCILCANTSQNLLITYNIHID